MSVFTKKERIDGYLKHKFLFLIILLIAVISQTLFAQAPDILWTKTFGGINDDYGISVQQTSDEGYIIAGHTDSFGAGKFDVYLIKASNHDQSDTLWTKTIGGPSDDYAECVRLIADGACIITGYTYSFGAGKSDVYLIKTNNLGDTLWTKAIGGADYDHGRSVQQTNDNGFIIAGHTMSYGAGSDDIYLIKTDSLGDTLWTKTYGGSSVDIGRSVQQTADSGYIIAGHTMSYGAGSDDIYLVKTDSLGDTLWTKTIGQAGIDHASSIQQTDDGGYIIVGHKRNQAPAKYDVYLVKINANGDTIWTKTIGGDEDDYGESVQQTADGGYIVSGYTFSFGAGRADVYIIKTNASGNTLWTKTIGSSLYEKSFSIQQTTDKGYIVSGWKDIGNGNDEVFLIKLDTDPTKIGDGLINHVPQNIALYQNYPNPFNPKTNINYELPISNYVELSIYNLLGQKVATLVNEKQTPGNYSVTFDGAGLASGLYFYKLRTNNFTRIKKMILAK